MELASHNGKYRDSSRAKYPVPCGCSSKTWDNPQYYHSDQHQYLQQNKDCEVTSISACLCEVIGCTVHSQNCIKMISYNDRTLNL